MEKTMLLPNRSSPTLTLPVTACKFTVITHRCRQVGPKFCSHLYAKVVVQLTGQKLRCLFVPVDHSIGVYPSRLESKSRRVVEYRKIVTHGLGRCSPCSYLQYWTMYSMTVRDNVVDVVPPTDFADSVTLYGCSNSQGNSYSRPNIV